MSTATLVPPAPEKVKPIPRRELQRRLRLLGISQNELARRIGRDQGLVGRVVRRELTSSPIWKQIYAFFETAGVPYPEQKKETAA